MYGSSQNATQHILFIGYMSILWLQTSLHRGMGSFFHKRWFHEAYITVSCFHSALLTLGKPRMGELNVLQG